jgi:hypothetical protein
LRNALEFERATTLVPLVVAAATFEIKESPKIRIEAVELLSKSGGRSGDWARDAP